MSHLRRLLTGLAAAFVAIAVAAVPASAGVLVSSASSCADQAFERPFMPWLDPAQYTLAPGGTLEEGTDSWSLTGGAASVAGNEPFNVHGAGETRSLALPAGSTATTAPMCVGIEHPTLRLFAKRNGGSLLGTLRVDVLYEDAGGTARWLTIGSVLSLNTQWAPTLPMVVTASLLPLLPGEHTAVAFRFVSQSSSWTIDDVYVDPYCRC